MNPDNNTNPGQDTKDKVFLLSVSEAELLYKSNEDRMCKATDYAVSNNVYIDNDTKCCVWWLRTPGYISDYASTVYGRGAVGSYGYYVSYEGVAVRPALWISLDSEISR